MTAALAPDRIALLTAAFKRRRRLLRTFTSNTISVAIRAAVGRRQ